MTEVARRPGRAILRRAAAPLAAAMMLGACTGPRGTPPERFAATLSSFFGQPFAFEITIEADRPSLNELGEGAQAAADFLSGLRLAGVVDGNRAALDLSAFGVQDLAQLVVLGTDELHLRGALTEFAVAAGSEPLDARLIGEQLEAAEVDAPVRDAVARLLAGDWIGVTGLDSEGDDPETDSDGADLDLDAAGDALTDIFGGDLVTFVDRFLTLSESVDGDVARWEVTLDLAGLVVASGELSARLGLGNAIPAEDATELLGNLPARVPGVVVVEDGTLAEMTFDLAAALAGDAEGGAGHVLVRVAFDAEPRPVVAPDHDAVVTLEDITNAVNRFVTWRAIESLRQLSESLDELADEPSGTPTGG